MGRARVDTSPKNEALSTASRDIADAALARVRARLARRSLTQRGRRWLVLGGILATCLASAGLAVLVVALLLARESPSWWRTVDTADPSVVELADRVERAIVSAMHRARPAGEPWTVAVTAEQANAWLNVKLPRWVRSREAGWPAELSQVQTHFEHGRVSVGMRIVGREGGVAQIVAATVNPELRHGALWLRQPATNAGRLDLPAGWTIARLRSWLPPEIRRREMTRHTLDALMQKGPVLPDLSLRLEDGRRVRLVGLRIDEERLLLTCVTELPKGRLSVGAD